jgi:methyl acetate hydrolase
VVQDAEFGAAIEQAGLIGCVALIGDQGSMRYQRAFGHRNREDATAMTSDTLFQIASMTKAITTVAALQLVERGQLSLDGAIGEVLPALANPMILEGFDAAGAPLLRAATQAITLRHLLTHTSGMGYDFANADLLRFRTSRGDVDRASGKRAGIEGPLLFEPGTRWEYGVSTDWVGLAVEAASGVSLGTWMATHIFAPLGMADTGFRPKAEQSTRCASMYARSEDNSLMPFPIDIGGGAAAEFEAGGSGLWSTAGDYLRFLQMILTNGASGSTRILSAESVALMRSNQVGPIRAGKMGSTMAALANPYDAFPDQHCGWSLAFLVNPEQGPNGRAAQSLAWAGIANCYYWIDPAQGQIGIFLAQLLPFADPGARAAAEAFERMAYLSVDS